MLSIIISVFSNKFNDKHNEFFFNRHFLIALLICFCFANFSCGSSGKKVDFMPEKSVTNTASAASKNDFSNALHVYLKELENNNMLQKIKKSGDTQFLSPVLSEQTVKLPYEQSLTEANQYFQDKRYDDAAKSFKKALSYPSVPPVKTLEIKFMLMTCLRELGREPEFISQLNEYKQKYTEIIKSCEVEYRSGMSNSALIQVIVDKGGESSGAPGPEKQKNCEDDEE